MKSLSLPIAALAAALCLAGCGRDETPQPRQAPAPIEPVAVSDAPAESAAAFIARANAEIDELDLEQGAASWVSVTYINGDTALLASRANARVGELMGRLIEESNAYDGA